MGILQHIEHQISALNDLIKINNDRVEGYQKAIELNKDTDLVKIFEDNIAQSKANVNQLIEEIHVLGGSPSEGTTVGGKFYRTWMNVKAMVSTPDRLSVLADCERGEDVATAAYRDALDDKELIWKEPDLVKLLEKQNTALKAAHDKIKVLRDEAKPVLK